MIINFILGEVRVKVTGLNLERAISVNMWDIKRTGYTTLYATTSYIGEKRLKQMGYSVERIGEKSLIKTLSQLLHKKTLTIGLFVVATLVFVLSRGVYFVDVSGNTSIPTDKVLSYVNEYGLSIVKSHNDIDKLCDYLVDKDDIMWASAGYDGIRLNLIIIEEKREDDNSPCDIIAKSDAVIKSIYTYKGVQMAVDGQIVKKGDMLIFGNGDNARGEIFGECVYKSEYKCSQNDIKYTGECVIKTDIISVTGKVDKGNIPYESYEIVENKTLIGENIFPIYLVDYNIKEVANKDDNLQPSTNNDLIEQAKIMALKNADIPKDASITDIKEEIIKDKEKILVRLTIKTMENIGIKAY